MSTVPPNTPQGIGKAEGLEQIFNLANLEDPEAPDTRVDEPETVADEASVLDAEDAVYETVDDAPDETDDQDHDPNEEDEQPELYTVRVNGEDLQVTFDELQKGYSRESDYRRKTQDVAEKRRDAEKQIEAATAHAQQIEQERAQYAQLLPQLAAQLQAENTDETINWQAAYDADPIEASRLEHQHRAAKESRESKLKAIQSEQQRLMQENQQRHQGQLQQHLAEQARLLPELIPEWTDETVASTEREALKKWAVDSGHVQSDHINQISEASHVSLLRKAWLYDQGKAKVQEQRKVGATSKKGRPVRPGSKASAPRSNKTAIKQAVGKLKRTGHYRDAAAVLMNLDDLE